jgi:RHS repeat-associated protein
VKAKTMKRAVRQTASLLAAGAILLAPLAEARAGEEIVYYHNDIVGSPSIAMDEWGTVLWRENYEPYGTRVDNDPAASKNPLWFTGKYAEAEIGLQYFGARWYDPTLGRFVAVDPAGFREEDLNSFNAYAYANNNPYRFIDPDGNIVTETALVFAGTAVVTAADAAIVGAIVVVGTAALSVAASWLGTFGLRSAAQYLITQRGSLEAWSAARQAVRNTTPSPALQDSPYSPRSVDQRRSALRRELELKNIDPDSPIPDQPPGENLKDGVHRSEGKQAHQPGQRNIAGKGMEEHNVKAPGTGGTGPKRP